MNLQEIKKRALIFSRKWEGEFSDDHHDPGGMTMKGITWRTWNTYAKLKRLPLVEQGETEKFQKLVTEDIAIEIFLDKYWRPLNRLLWIDTLPPATAIAIFDLGLNSGNLRPLDLIRRMRGEAGGNKKPFSIHDYQRLLQSIATLGDKEYAKKLTDRRLEFLKCLTHWSHFARGWTNRCNDLKDYIDTLPNTDHKLMEYFLELHKQRAEGGAYLC